MTKDRRTNHTLKQRASRHNNLIKPPPPPPIPHFPPPPSTPRAQLRVVGMLRFISKTQTNRACPRLFILFLCLFFVFMALSTVFHSTTTTTTKKSQQLSAFSLCSRSLNSALMFPSTIHLFLKVSLSPGITALLAVDWAPNTD